MGEISETIPMVTMLKDRIRYNNNKNGVFTMSPLLRVVLSSSVSLLLLLAKVDVVTAVFDCKNDEQCESLIMKGSKCKDGLCTNPYYEGGGCLKTKLGENWRERLGLQQPEPRNTSCYYERGGCLKGNKDGEEDIGNWTKRLHLPRICNSQDPMPQALVEGHCRLSPLNYTEIRIELQNWDSAVFTTYIMQILLSELLDVPTSVETSFLSKKGNFYDPHLNLKYGWSDDERALNRSAMSAMPNSEQDEYNGDCVPYTAVQTNPDDYLACAHLIPETMDSFRWTPPFVEAGILETPYPMGELAREGWHIPLHTAINDGTLLHWTGLVGEKNRQKLAKMFKRPVSYKEYCEQVSPTNCTIPDGTASRPPENSNDEGWDQPYRTAWYKSEHWRYHVPGDVYNGYFRYTDENNCTLFPDTCSGHIVDFPCGWSSYTEAQAYHLGIALQSSGPDGPPRGYFPDQMPQIWRAAKETNSHVIMHWTDPTALTYEYLDTNYSLERVALPRTTQVCTNARRPNKERCSEDKMLRVGSDPDGACDERAEARQKIFSTSLHHITKGEHIDMEFHSPAYEALRTFTISDLQIGEIFTILANWTIPNTRNELGLRDSVCEWVVSHMDVMETLVPKSYPRIIEESPRQPNDPLNIVTLLVALIALGFTLVVIVATYVRREKNSIRRAQIDFLFLILAGLLLVSLGSVLTALPTNDGMCVAIAWVTNFGYSLELVPLVVKLAALNRLMQAGQRCHRIDVKPRSLYAACASIGVLVIVVLMVWTVLDPPQEQGFYTLSDDVTPRGESVVRESFQCESDWMYWWVICISWQALLLLVAAVIAFQNREFREDLVETRTLAMMIYSHLLFVGLRASTFVIQTSDFIEKPQTAALFRGLLNSADVMVTLAIYFLPKFLAKDQRGSSSRSSTFITGLQAAAAVAAAEDHAGAYSGDMVAATPTRHSSSRRVYWPTAFSNLWNSSSSSNGSLRGGSRGNNNDYNKSSSNSSSSKKESSVYVSSSENVSSAPDADELGVLPRERIPDQMFDHSTEPFSLGSSSHMEGSSSNSSVAEKEEDSASSGSPLPEVKEDEEVQEDLAQA